MTILCIAADAFNTYHAQVKLYTFTHLYTNVYIHIHDYIYNYIYMCLYTYMYVDYSNIFMHFIILQQHIPNYRYNAYVCTRVYVCPETDLLGYQYL